MKEIFAILAIMLFGFIAFGSSTSNWGWGQSSFFFQGVPTFPAVSWQPTFFSFVSGSSFVSAPVIIRPSSFRFVFLDP